MAMWALKATIAQFWPKLAFLSKSVLEPQAIAISWPDGRFYNNLTYGCSSALNDTVPGEKRHLISKTAVRQQFFHKTAQVGENGTFFGFWLGHCHYWDEVSFFPWKWLFNTELQTQWAFLKNVRRAEVWRLNLGALGQRRLNIRGHDFKKRRFSNSKFNVDSVFAIKHDLTQLFD